jgi:uridine kinase
MAAAQRGNAGPVMPAAEQLAEAIRGWQAGHPGPLVIAIDGYGASGKTTIASELELALDAVVVHTDHYYEDHGLFDHNSHPMAQYYHWEPLRRECLEPTIERGVRLILVEGVSSAAPALADLIDRTVFVETPESVRLERLHGRITDEEWDEDWLQAERLYFASRPPESFDLIVAGA